MAGWNKAPALFANSSRGYEYLVQRQSALAAATKPAAPIWLACALGPPGPAEPPTTKWERQRVRLSEKARQRGQRATREAARESAARVPRGRRRRGARRVSHVSPIEGDKPDERFRLGERESEEDKRIKLGPCSTGDRATPFLGASEALPRLLRRRCRASRATLAELFARADELLSTARVSSLESRRRS